MKITIPAIIGKRFSRSLLFIGLLLLNHLTVCCKNNSSENSDSEEKVVTLHGQNDPSLETSQKPGASNQPGGTFPDQGNLVKVVSTGMNFNVAEELSSGWTTFRYYNESPMTHFFILRSLPVIDGEQKTVQNQIDETIDIYDGALEYIIAGEQEKGFALLRGLPGWTGEMVSFGGVGMLSPGQTGQTDVYLDPGLYQMECYIKTGGRFHGSLGMVKEIAVTEENSDASPPEPTISMDISMADGFSIDDEIAPGRHVLEVFFKDQVSENGSGHDVSLVKIEEGSDLEELANWMTWTTAKGMETPAPKGTFLGGVQNLRAGERGYMTVDIAPGDYAWISEGRNLSSRNLVKPFTVRPH